MEGDALLKDILLSKICDFESMKQPLNTLVYMKRQDVTYTGSTDEMICRLKDV